MDKNDVRSAIFAQNHFKTAIFKLFDVELELRQPSVGQLMNLSKLDKEQEKLAVAQILIDYAYMPGTEDKIFGQADYDAIVNLPSGTWISDLFELWGNLAGGNGAQVEKNSETI